MKRGPKLNLIKKFGERVGGGGNPTTLTVSSLVKEAKSDKKKFWGRGWGGGGVRALKPKQYARLCQMR